MFVIPAKAGIQLFVTESERVNHGGASRKNWIPAFAGMTGVERRGSPPTLRRIGEGLSTMTRCSSALATHPPHVAKPQRFTRTATRKPHEYC